MIVTDPIADMLTRLRNAITAKHDSVLVPVQKKRKQLQRFCLTKVTLNLMKS